MSFEKRDNNGTLGRNEKKTESKHPDHKGQCTVGGVDYWISAWIKDGTNSKFFSLSFTPKEAKPNAPVSAEDRAKVEDDEIPF